jgi:outer membrane biosynthesis protein TonB
MKQHFSIVFVLFLACACAHAEETRVAPTGASPLAGPSEVAPGQMSQSKFLGELYAEIARHTPAKSPAGKGEVRASFHVNAQGKVDKVVTDRMSSDALAKAVKQILASVQAPPPPGGGADVSQVFKFH